MGCGIFVNQTFYIFLMENVTLCEGLDMIYVYVMYMYVMNSIKTILDYVELIRRLWSKMSICAIGAYTRITLLEILMHKLLCIQIAQLHFQYTYGPLKQSLYV